ERAYTVPGGKTTHVYGVDRTSAPLGGGVTVQLQDYRGGPGKTAPLGKGPVLATGGRDLAGGGLGFGVPVVRYDDGWWYPGGTTGLRPTPDGSGWQQEYDLSLREVDGPDGRFQRFEAGPSHGRVLVTYHLHVGQVDVQVRPVELAPGLREAVVLNEESAGFQAYADGSQTEQASAIGSQRPVTGGWARLRSDADGVEFGIEAPANVQSFSAARERLPDRGIDFSGLEMGFGPGFTGADYTVTVRRS
ncbi:MAG TPA: hypothetical protein VFA92_14825, partial [Candidatus Binatia bacterium]|nr:hypothetical protein [Candidatus Binatia bacterium]